MKRIAWLLLLAGGCGYSNPWDTSDDVEAYKEAQRTSVGLSLERLFEPPQIDQPVFVEPDLEAWRDTDLVFSSQPVLNSMAVGSKEKLGGLETRLEELVNMDPHNAKRHFTRTKGQYIVERRRGKMVAQYGGKLPPPPESAEE